MTTEDGFLLIHDPRNFSFEERKILYQCFNEKLHRHNKTAKIEDGFDFDDLMIWADMAHHNLQVDPSPIDQYYDKGSENAILLAINKYFATLQKVHGKGIFGTGEDAPAEYTTSSGEKVSLFFGTLIVGNMLARCIPDFPRFAPRETDRDDDLHTFLLTTSLALVATLFEYHDRWLSNEGEKVSMTHLIQAICNQFKGCIDYQKFFEFVEEEFNSKEVALWCITYLPKTAMKDARSTLWVRANRHLFDEQIKAQEAIFQEHKDSVLLLRAFLEYPLKLSFNEIVRRYPEWYDRAYPRQYVTPEGYSSPKWFVVAAACLTLLRKSLSKKNPDYDIIGRSISSILNDSVPTYFIAEKLAMGLQKTGRPTGITLNEINWPLDHFLVIPPLDTGIRYFMLSKQPECVFGIVLIGDHHHGFIIGLNEDLGQSIDKGKFFCFREQGDNAVSPEAADEIVAFIINVLFSMSAQPEWRETLVIDSPAVKHNNPKKAKEAIWKPRFFGLPYKQVTHSQDADGERGSPRMHWRRGHWRHTSRKTDENPHVNDVDRKVHYLDDLRKVWVLEEWSHGVCKIKHGDEMVEVPTREVFISQSNLHWINPVQVMGG